MVERSRLAASRALARAHAICQAAGTQLCADACAVAQYAASRVVPALQDKQRAKEAAAQHAARVQREDKLAHLLGVSKLDELGVQLHNVLKHYPHVRARWLAGDSLLSLLDERKGVLPGLTPDICTGQKEKRAAMRRACRAQCAACCTLLS